MHIVSKNVAETLVWKHEYDVKLWRHKHRTPNTNDNQMQLNETLDETFLHAPLDLSTSTVHPWRLSVTTAPRLDKCEGKGSLNYFRIYRKLSKVLCSGRASGCITLTTCSICLLSLTGYFNKSRAPGLVWFLSLGLRNTHLPELAVVTFSDSDYAPVLKFLNPHPALNFYQVWESDPC